MRKARKAKPRRIFALKSDGYGDFDPVFRERAHSSLSGIWERVLGAWLKTERGTWNESGMLFKINVLSLVTLLLIADSDLLREGFLGRS